MAEFTIRPYGDPVLRAVGEPVREFGPPLRTLGDAMLRAMKAAKGIGLAAPQVGLSLQLFVMDVHDEDFAPVLDGKERQPADIMPMLLANAKVDDEALRLGIDKADLLPEQWLPRFQQERKGSRSRRETPASSSPREDRSTGPRSTRPTYSSIQR